MVRPGHLARRHARPAAHERGVRGRVVRRPERPAPDEAVHGAGPPATEAMIVASRASSSSSGGRTPGIVEASIVLPDPGGPMRTQPVAARRGRSRAPVAPRTGRGRRPGPGRSPARSAARPRRRHLRGNELGAAARAGGPPTRRPRSASAASASVAAPTTSMPGDEPRLGERAGGHDHAARPAAGERRDHRQDARHRPDLAAEAELAEERPRPARRHLLRADEDRDGDPEVQRRAGLGHVRRGEVDRDPARRDGRTRCSAGRRAPARGPRGGRRRRGRRS